MSLQRWPEVTVAVVTWNSMDHLPGLLDSLPAALEGVASWRLVVADNGSTDGGPAQIANLAPATLIVPLNQNRGFAAGVNAAAAACPPKRALLVLNPDVRPAPGSALQLLEVLSEPGIGIAVPRLVGADGRLHLSLRREPTILRTLGQAFLGRRAGRLRALGEVVADPAAYQRPGITDWATGAMLMVSRDCLDLVGPWDESFFMYSEETDFALRARDRGFATRFVPEASGVHLGGDSEYTKWLWSILTVNRVRLFRRRHGPIRGCLFAAAVVVNEVPRALMPGRHQHRAALRALLWPVRSPVEPAR